MLKIYETHKVNNTELSFKLDFNELTSEYDPHTWIRHQVEPIEAVVSYFNISENRYNSVNKRYEAYSETDNITLYYFYLNASHSKVIIITAMRGYCL